MNFKVLVTSDNQYNALCDLANNDYSKYPFLKEVRKKINENKFLGRLDPFDTIISLKDVSHTIEDVYIKDYYIYAKVKVLNTEAGILVKDLLSQNFPMNLVCNVEYFNEEVTNIFEFQLNTESHVVELSDVFYKKIRRGYIIDDLLK
jgi:hypothetical protein